MHYWRQAYVFGQILTPVSHSIRLGSATPPETPLRQRSGSLPVALPLAGSPCALFQVIHFRFTPMAGYTDSL